MTYIPLPTSRTEPAEDALAVVTRVVGSVTLNNEQPLSVNQAVLGYARIDTIGVFQLKEGSGSLYRLIFSAPSPNAVTLYDSLTASGTVIGVVQPGPSMTPFSLDFGIPFTTGLTVKTAGMVDLLVVYE